MTYDERIKRIARALGMEWTPRMRMDKHRGRWWLLGAVSGDQPLPNTGGCNRLPDALDAAEAWLAPELLRDGDDE